MHHTKSPSLPTLSSDELITATGGAGAGGIDIAGIASQIGAMAGGQKGQQMGGQVGGIIQQLIGSFGNMGGGAAAGGGGGGGGGGGQ